MPSDLRNRRARHIRYEKRSVNHGGYFPIIQAVVSFCWSLFKWGLLVGLAGAVIAAAYLYRQMDEEVRRRVEQHFARHYPHLKVTVRSAELVEGEGIKVRGLSILDPSAEGPRAELVHLEEAFLWCRADLSALLTGLEVSRVLLRRPTLRATRQADGSWNVAKLLRLPPSGSGMPTVWIEAGRIEIFDPLKNPSAELVVRHVNLEVFACEKPSPPGFGPTTRQIRGTLSSDFFENMEIEGLIDPDKGWWTLSGSIAELEISPALRHALPADLAAKFPVPDSFRGLATLAFRIESSASDESPIRYELAGELTRGRIEDSRLPRPLTDLRTGFRISNAGLTIEDLSGISGPATLQVKLFRLAGFDFRGPMWLEAQVRELELDGRLREMLPEALRPEWDKFLPAGKIHADVKLHYDGRHWKPDVTVECLDASFTYYKFPYPLEHVRGQIEWKNDKVDVNLVGDSGGRQVHVRGEVLDPAPGSRFWFKVSGNDLPLDEKLFRALREKAREAVCSLNPRGRADIFFHVWRDEPGQPSHKHLDLAVHNAWVCYDKFPYPLSNISGIIERNDDHWDFRNFQGTNDTARITCNGQLDVTPQGNRWDLQFAGTNVPLEEELRLALPRPNMQQLWNALKARGMVDFKAAVRRLPGEEASKLTFLAADLDSDTTSIQPVWFPYRMENLQGTLIYHGNGHVSMEQLRGEHGRTTMRAAVDCDFLPDGSWHLRLGNLSVDRLYADRELILALPGRLREVVEQLKPGGPVNLHHGTLELAHGQGPAAPFTSNWNLAFTFAHGSIDCGIKLENLNGSLTLVGSYDGQKLRSRGELDLDSLTYRGVQFTRVMGPLEIDDDLVRFGASVRRRPDEPGRKVTAQLFGGTLRGSGWVAIRSQPQYQLHGTLADGDLACVAQELMAGRQHLRGKITAEVVLRGVGRSLNGLEGLGRIELRNADVYEVPLMIALLNILSVRQPDPTAFSSSDIDFRIHGGHIYLTNITFQGDAFRLSGSGLMEFDTSIRLTFRAMLGRREWDLPLVREFLERVSEEIMVIHVGGTLQEPIQFREPFPGVNEALRQLQAEVQRTTGAPALFPPSGQFFLPSGERALSGARRLPRRQ